MPNRAAPLDEMPEAGQAILTAARDIVEKNGPNSLRVSDVAERAGVAVGLLYHYFDDRDDLIDAVREALENPQAEMFASPLALGELNLKIKSSNDLMQLRRQAELDRRKAEEAARAAGTFYAPNSEQIFINRAGRRLKRDATGGVGR